MLRLKPQPTFTAKVKIPDPAGEPMEFTATFKHKTKTEFEDFKTRTAGKSDLETVAEVLIGWDGVDAPFSGEALQTLLDSYPGASFAISKAYGIALFEGRQGN